MGGDVADTARGVDEPEFLPVLDIDAKERQSRLVVLFRVILVIPHIIVLWALGIVTFFVALIGWFAALFTGRLPEGIASFLTGYVAWRTRVAVYMFLLDDRYPPFAFEAPDHPVRIEVRPGPLNRLAVFFRFILIIPAAIVAGITAAGWGVCALVFWLIILIMGRVPGPIFGSTAAVARYQLRESAYWLLLTSAYPKRLFGDESTFEAGRPRASATQPLLLSNGARFLLVLYIVLGVLAALGSGVSRPDTYETHDGGYGGYGAPMESPPP
ncbi:MAG: DUF4389 domain-containing protein [Streptosporangiales bacterium]|nr:DUF4389 domain-containing protein [Streptosporangiales bacterium]